MAEGTTTEERLARACQDYSWGYTKELIARRMLLDGVDAVTLAREIKRSPGRIKNVLCEVRRELWELAQLEEEAGEYPLIFDLNADRPPVTEGEHAALLLDCFQTVGSNPGTGPQPIEGDRDAVAARVVTFELCLQAHREVKYQAPREEFSRL